MLRMVVFDFDGVITDSERAHYDSLKSVLREEGIKIGWDEYCEKYLTYGDYECFENALRDAGRQVDTGEIEELVARKRVIFEQYQAKNLVIFPGIEKLLANLQENSVICAICSSACRGEIEFFLKQTGLAVYFDFIVSDDDVQNGKPNPEGYKLSIHKANQLIKKRADNRSEKAQIRAGDCVAIEDSFGGIAAAKAAGLYCLAVTNSYPAERLQQADLVIEDLSKVDTDFLRQLLI